MSKLITIDSLTNLRRLFREKGEINPLIDSGFFTSHNDSIIQFIDAPDYPDLISNVVAEFYSTFESNPKNEFELAKIIYENIRINRAQAANNQYWVYVNLTYFRDFIKKRWIKINEEDQNEIDNIKIDRYFLAVESSQNSLIKSPIAGLWWAIELTIDLSLEDPYYYSKIFLSDRNLRDKNMGTYKLIRHKYIFQAMLEFYEKYKNSLHESKRIGSEAIAQQLSKTINQIGGLTLLSYLSKDEISDKLEEYKDLILLRARNVQVRKVISREKIQSEKKSLINSQINSPISKYFNISSYGLYCLKDNPDSENFEFNIPIHEDEVEGFMMFCYNENGKINRVNIFSILQKKKEIYRNGIFLGNTINNIFNVNDENDIIGILITRNNEKYFKGHLVHTYKENNSNVGLSGYKSLYEEYDSVIYFRIPSNLHIEIKRLVPSSFTAKCTLLKNKYYQKEWDVLKRYFPTYFK